MIDCHRPCLLQIIFWWGRHPRKKVKQIKIIML
jgi:hypothetical protein